jgi:hypothetical protein
MSSIDEVNLAVHHSLIQPGIQLKMINKFGKKTSEDLVHEERNNTCVCTSSPVTIFPTALRLAETTLLKGCLKLQIHIARIQELPFTYTKINTLEETITLQSNIH